MIRAVAPLLLLAGCAAAPLASLPPTPQPYDRLTVVTSERSVDLAVPPGAATLPADARAALAGFRAVAGPAVRGDRWTLVAAHPDDPRLTPVRAALGPVDPALAAEPRLAPGTIRVALARAVVTVAGCPDWSGPAREDFTNRPSSNFGCADAHNLAAMLDDPADLVAGRTGAPAEAGTQALALQRYRAGQVTPLSTGGDLPFAPAAAPAAAPPAP